MFGIFEVGAIEIIRKYLEKFKWIGPACERPMTRVPSSAHPHVRGDATVAQPPPATSRRRCRPTVCHLPLHVRHVRRRLYPCRGPSMKQRSISPLHAPAPLCTACLAPLAVVTADAPNHRSRVPEHPRRGHLLLLPRRPASTPRAPVAPRKLAAMSAMCAAANRSTPTSNRSVDASSGLARAPTTSDANGRRAAPSTSVPLCTAATKGLHMDSLL
jgi:hypothetical protein